MFRYFDDNYTWDLALNAALDCGANMTEIDAELSPLRSAKFDNWKDGDRAWFDAWTRMGRKLEKYARLDEEQGFDLTAGKKFTRAGVYYTMADRFFPDGVEQQLPSYRHMVETFLKGVKLSGDDVELVSVPYRGSSLPAYFVRAKTDGPAPCVISLNGFDSSKEWIYPVVAPSFTKRGMHALVVDQAGTGGALRENNIPAIAESEASASACVDFLIEQSGVDASKIALMGASLGGYYAPRAAAFEHRLAACIAWGGLWDLGEVFQTLDQDGVEQSMPDMLEHAMWSFGQDNPEDTWAVINSMRLEDVIKDVRCPLLVIHGEHDLQAGVSHATRTYEGAVNSAKRELKIFTTEEGGAMHCQVDNMPLATDYAADWCAKLFKD